MLSQIHSATLVGVNATLVVVETDIASRGFPQLKIVGLPGKSVEEAKERVHTALNNVGYDIPAKRVVVNLAPADIPKQSSRLDLPIALGILAAQGFLDITLLPNALFIGEISLNGDVLPVSGVLPILIFAHQKGFSHAYIPSKNTDEAEYAGRGLSIYGIKSLGDIIQHLSHKITLMPLRQKFQKNASSRSNSQDTTNDFCHIRGQQHAKRALEVAAAGGHSVILRGPPGTGKTMLAKSFLSLFPPLTDEESIEVAQIQSIICGGKGEGLSITRPFRAPHHSISRAGMIGGGADLAPGEITLAHRGVLFLDEFPEFPRSIVEALRQPIEEGVVHITRVRGSVTYPCRSVVIAAANPCPCGYHGHHKKSCTCSLSQIDSYNKRISGPILDRIDIHVQVPNLLYQDFLGADDACEPSSKIRERVIKARFLQSVRFSKSRLKSNSEMSPQDVKKYVHLDQEATQLLSVAFSKFNLSPRSYFKLLKVSQTIADLKNQNTISHKIIAEAVQYRHLYHQ